MTWQGMKPNPEGWIPRKNHPITPKPKKAPTTQPDKGNGPYDTQKLEFINTEQIEQLKQSLLVEGVKVPLNFIRNFLGKTHITNLAQLELEEARDVIRAAKSEDWKSFLRWCQKASQSEADIFNSRQVY